MIRDIVRKSLTEEKSRSRFAVLLRLLFLVSALALLSAPFYANEVRPEENALHGSYLES